MRKTTRKTKASHAKHTPGPWIYEDGEINTDTKSGGWKAIVTVTANSLGSLKVTEEEADANGKLIAAAPELLEACNAYIRYLQAKIDSGRFKYAEAQLKNQCLAAIAKAEKRLS